MSEGKRGPVIGAGVGLVLLVFAMRVCTAKARYDSAIDRINNPPPPRPSAQFECETTECVAGLAKKYAAGLEAAGRAADAARVNQIAKALEAGDCSTAQATKLPEETAQNATLLLDHISVMTETMNVCMLQKGEPKRDAEPASDKVMIHAWLPDATLDAMKKEAARRDRSVSWCAARVWEMSKADIGKVRGTDGGRASALPWVDGGAEQPLIFPQKTLAEIDAEVERLGGTRGEILALAWAKAGKRFVALDGGDD